MRSTYPWWLLCLAGSLAACSASYPAQPSPVPAGLLLTYSRATGPVLVGNSVVTSAYLFDSDGVYQPVTPAAWSSANPSIAAHVGSGLVRAFSAGTTEVFATYQGFTSSILVVAQQSTPPFPYLVVSASGPFSSQAFVALQAQYVEAAGRSRDVTAQTTFRSSDPGIATIAGSRLTEIQPGTVEVTGTFNDSSAWVRHSVQPMFGIGPGPVRR